MDRTISEIKGWKQLGLSVDRVHAAMPRAGQTFLFGLNYQIASELAFYVPDNPHTVSINRWNRPNVYDYWWNDDDLIGQDAIGVLEDGKSRARLLQIFERVAEPETFQVGLDSLSLKHRIEPAKTVKKFYFYRCYGFKGGLRWIPRDAADVRG